MATDCEAMIIYLVINDAEPGRIPIGCYMTQEEAQRAIDSSMEFNHSYLTIKEIYIHSW